MFRRTLAYEHEKQIIKAEVAHVDYPTISNCLANILVVFPSIFTFFAVFQNSYAFYYTISVGTPTFRGT
jgi:hypothetical protein